MALLIVTPPSDVRTGNDCTAQQWAGLLRSLGRDVRVANAYRGEAVDAVVVLHAVHGHEAATLARARRVPVVLALTGTDVYPAPGATALATMEMADRIVGLQDRVRGQVPAKLHAALRIIVQGVPAPAIRDEPNPDGFVVAVVAHLREVKDPLRAAAAARLLPPSSHVRVRLAGAILESAYEARVASEQRDNPRFEWLGEIDGDAVARLLASSRLSVVSSFHEGGARALGESVVAGTPVLGARNDAAESLLGADYPGLYAAGDTRELAGLLARAESDSGFLAALAAATARAAEQFDPARERAAWADLLAELPAAQAPEQVAGKKRVS